MRILIFICLLTLNLTWMNDSAQAQSATKTLPLSALSKRLAPILNTVALISTGLYATTVGVAIYYSRQNHRSVHASELGLTLEDMELAKAAISQITEDDINTATTLLFPEANEEMCYSLESIQSEILKQLADYAANDIP